ncbi:hypothetical protein C9374_002982 [Naegleria lovaniensis]|uniref:Uncharacterized protein n=1 Tax=Naegleria lovaniensis TaxID=51637 RepID=A0AA88GT77_NAELO|nr:uncharacterized protein C9374_002982 [Naegleria lovaniensis]KAG2385833.1 hypothetical protein C9374_002982 [Naegleria lovaniensis]
MRKGFSLPKSSIFREGWRRESFIMGVLPWQYQAITNAFQRRLNHTKYISSLKIFEKALITASRNNNVALVTNEYHQMNDQIQIFTQQRC